MSEIRPEWMPTEFDLLNLSERVDSVVTHVRVASLLEESHTRTGLRAQVSVLEEILIGTADRYARDGVKEKIAQLQAQLGEAGG